MLHSPVPSLAALTLDSADSIRDAPRSRERVSLRAEAQHYLVGLMVTRPGVTGLAITDEPQLRIVECDDVYANVGAFRVPVTPMIGLLGVAPNGDPVSTFRGAEHGGNMDILLIGTGTRVFLPTFCDGGMVYFGDVHAAMGDGEVFLSGVEIAGRIRARVTVAAYWSLPTPLVETDELVAVIASGSTFDEAAKAVMAKAVEVLSIGGMDPIDAGFLMSAAGHLREIDVLAGAEEVANRGYTRRTSVPHVVQHAVDVLGSPRSDRAHPLDVRRQDVDLRAPVP